MELHSRVDVKVEERLARMIAESEKNCCSQVVMGSSPALRIGGDSSLDSDRSLRRLSCRNMNPKA